MKISDLKGEIKVVGKPISQESKLAPEQINAYQKNFVEPLGQFSTGFAKGGLSTIFGLGKIGTKIGRTLLPKFAEPKETIYEKEKPEILKPQTTAEKIGFGAEQIAEYFIPASKAAKAEKAVNLLSTGIKSPLLASLSRIGGKSAIQGLTAGGVKFVQTGGEIKEAVKTGVLAGGVRAGMAIIGEGARAFHLPERLYSMIFKNSAKDMITELKSGGLQFLQKNNPDKFNELVQKGIIKIGADGQTIFNDTLAEQAIDKGLRGSIRNMANEVVEGALDSEDKVRQVAQTYQGTINVSEKQFVNILKEIADDYKNVGFGEIADDANNLIQKIKTGGGKLSAEDTLIMRRLLDRVRIGSSFDKVVTKLSQTQGNLKTLADTLRGRLNSIPEMSAVMKDYSFYIEALESLAKEAARRGNNQVLSLIDSIFLSGAYAGNNPIPGVTMGMLRKILQSGWGTTTLGQFIKNSNVSPLTSGLISGGSSAIQSGLSNR